MSALDERPDLDESDDDAAGQASPELREPASDEEAEQDDYANTQEEAS